MGYIVEVGTSGFHLELRKQSVRIFSNSANVDFEINYTDLDELALPIAMAQENRRDQSE